jgi:uncharacterized protein (TIGR03086 family)
MNVVDLHRRSIAEFTDRVRQVRPEQWSASTPCTEWSVRDLVNHVVGEERWAVPLFAGATIAEVGDRFDGDLLGDDPVAAALQAAAEADAAASEPGAADRTVHLSFGETPAEEYLWQLTADHLIHGWDLASAIGADRRFDPELVQAVAEWYADRERLYRAGGAVGPRVDLSDDADEQERLLSAFGRDPKWDGA